MAVKVVLLDIGKEGILLCALPCLVREPEKARTYQLMRHAIRGYSVPDIIRQRYSGKLLLLGGWEVKMSRLAVVHMDRLCMEAMPL